MLGSFEGRRAIAHAAFVLCVAGALATARAESPGASGPPLQATEIFELMGLSAVQVEALRGGEVVSVGLPDLETLDDQLAIAVLMTVDASLDQSVEAFVGTDWFSVDRDILDYERVPVGEDGSPELAAFARVGFSDSERGEVRRLLAVAPGSGFNLSAPEIERVRVAGQALPPDSPDTAAKLSAVYRDVLIDRFRAYLQRGLEGVEPYQRTAGKQTSPAAALASAAAEGAFLERFARDFYGNVRAYPDRETRDVEDRYYWSKQTIQGRPMYSLIHWMLTLHAGYAVLAQREFFVGHTYSCQQVFVGAMPFENRVLVLYFNRAATDRVTGFGAPLARRIGRGRLARNVRTQFESVRENLGVKSRH